MPRDKHFWTENGRLSFSIDKTYNVDDSAIPLSPMSTVTTMDIWKSSHWLGKSIVRSIDKKNIWIGALIAAI